MFDGHTDLYELIAAPAHHSLSPLIHNTSFNALNINSVYLAFDVEADELTDTVASLRALSVHGANVSMPYKEAVVPFMDELTPMAKRLGAVNTIINRHGHLVGDSTDGQGFVDALNDEAVSVTGKHVVVLGAGGAGRAVIAACVEAGAMVTVFKRQNRTFEAIQQQLTSWSPNITVLPYEDLDQMAQVVAEADVIINTTNVGMGADTGVPLADSVMAVLQPGQFVADAIYAPLETQFLKEAKVQGCQTMNGINMLIHQAARAFTQWTDIPMPVDTVKEAVNNHLLSLAAK